MDQVEALVTTLHHFYINFTTLFTTIYNLLDLYNYSQLTAKIGMTIIAGATFRHPRTVWVFSPEKYLDYGQVPS